VLLLVTLLIVFALTNVLKIVDPYRSFHLLQRARPREMENT